MTDLLVRKRLNDNIVDKVTALERRMAQLERIVLVATPDGDLPLKRLMVKVYEYTPPPPPLGHVIIYAEQDGTDIHLRAQDSEGTVKTLETWT